MHNTKKIILVGLFAALIFVATLYLKFEIPTPTGPTMIKTGNILCILAGLLLGKVYGGFAAGIGSMLFDVINPAYISSAPFTFVFFFLMAYLAGLIFEKTQKIILACFIGAFSYVILYFMKSVVETVLYGSGLIPAIVANFPKLITSSINATVATVFAMVLYPKVKQILSRR